MTIQTKPYGVERGQTRIKVPHEEGILTVVHPPEGPGTYTSTGKAVLAQNLPLAAGDEIASLLHAVYCGPDEFRNAPEIENVRNSMKNGWLWTFNRNLWTPEGVYVVQDPEAAGTSQPLNIPDLEARLGGGEEVNGLRFSADKSVRFAPKESYKLERHTPESLAGDGFVIISYGKKGAENLGEVSAKFDEPPFIYGKNVEKGKEPVQRVSALNSFWNNRRLFILGYVYGYGRGGCAFGVLKSGEASAREK